MRCRYALISYPVGNKNSYLILGELYDKNNINYIYENIKYLCPFRAKIILNDKGKIDIQIYNIEDIELFCKRFSLTTKPRLVFFKHVEFTIFTFHSPILWDITCNIPLFSHNIPRPNLLHKSITNPIPNIIIITPMNDPITRGKVIDDALKIQNPYFVVMDKGKWKKNKDTSATLAIRYLLCCRVPKNRIEKNTLELVNILEKYDSIYNPIILCDRDFITRISVSYRLWKKTRGIKNKVMYICN